MARFPYMRVYVNDVFGDTVTLSDAEFGSYLAILMAMWKAGGWLTLDQARKASRVAAGRWARRWSALAGYFEVEPDGRITQARVRDDLDDVGRLDDRRSKGVSAATTKQVSAETTKSGPNPLKDIEAASGSSRALPRRHSTAPEGREPTVVPFPLTQHVAVSDWPDVEPVQMVVEFANAVASPWLDLTKVISTKFHAQAPGYLSRWRDAGCSWTVDVLPVAIARAAELAEPINSLKAFDAAILAAHAARTAPIDPAASRRGPRHDDKHTRRQENERRSDVAVERLAAFVRDHSGGGFGDD